jgi:hypothetical protein
VTEDQMIDYLLVYFFRESGEAGRIDQWSLDIGLATAMRVAWRRLKGHAPDRREAALLAESWLMANPSRGPLV